MVTASKIRYEQLGTLARKVRIAMRLTQLEIAERTGITRDEVYAFENNLPVCLDSRRKVLKVLWALKMGKKTN